MSLLPVMDTCVENARLDSMATVKSATTSGTASTTPVEHMAAARTPVPTRTSAHAMMAGATLAAWWQVQELFARRSIRASWMKTTATRTPSATIRAQDSTAAPARLDTLAMETYVLTPMAVRATRALRASSALMFLRRAKGSRAASVP